MNTENAEMNEGTTFFDIIFYVRMKNGRSKIIINVEAQRKEPDKYRIINRAIFFCGTNDFFTEGTGIYRYEL